MTMNPLATATAMSLALVSAAPGQTAPAPARGVFVYSSLCSNTQSGDPAGYRFELIRRPGGDSALFEYGNGPLEGPLEVQGLSIQGLVLHGWVDSNDGRIILEGTIEARRLTLKALYPKPEAMQRIRSLDQAIPDCR